MTDGAIGALGVVVLFAALFIWTAVENAYRVKRQRRYDKRMSECDTSSRGNVGR